MIWWICITRKKEVLIKNNNVCQKYNKYLIDFKQGELL